ncbi:MAG: phosphonate C-P lyase system protein PhnH, partial [Hyphomicrobiales bacterium]
AGAWLRFHCGTALVEDPTEAAFAVIDGAAAGPELSAFNLGTDQFPDRSTTVIVQVASLEGGTTVTLAGPGILGSRDIAPQGLPPGFADELRDNGALYPLGVDVLLAHGESLIGLPRSTQIEETR